MHLLLIQTQFLMIIKFLIKDIILTIELLKTFYVIYYILELVFKTDF